jgi:hypothetical protein
MGRKPAKREAGSQPGASSLAHYRAIQSARCWTHLWLEEEEEEKKNKQVGAPGVGSLLCCVCTVAHYTSP